VYGPPHRRPIPLGLSGLRAVGKRASLLQKIRVLLDVRTPKYYELSQALGPEGQNPELFVHVVILPALLRNEIMPELLRAGVISLLSILGSILIAFVFSHFAFKPLSNVTRMLDHVTRGEYVSDTAAPAIGSNEDEFGVMVSKVNLLGQQLGNFEMLLDQLEEAVLVFGGDRRLIVASGALEKFLGKRRVDLMGLSMPDVFPPDIR
jgi:PAS domain-containing protein